MVILMLRKVLKHLVNNCCHGDDVSKESLYNKTLTLLARVTSQVMSSLYDVIVTTLLIR